MKNFYGHKSRLCTLMLALLTSACGAPSSALSPTWIGVSDVISDPLRYNGKEVTIKGWATVRSGSYRIWASRGDYEKHNVAQCITLLNSYTDDTLNKSVDGKTVLITGTVDKDIKRDKDGNPVIVLHACNDIGIRFTPPRGLRAF